MPNVRFNAAKVLEKLAPLVDARMVDGTIKPFLAGMAGDADADVRFFAAKALAACDGATEMK